LPVVHIVVLLKVAGLAIRIDEIAQRAAAGLDGQPEHPLDFGGQRRQSARLRSRAARVGLMPAWNRDSLA
jgi:hypothetical protein